MNMEHGTFTPLVFSLTGGEGPETSMFHKYIAQKIANKTRKIWKSSNTDKMQIIFPNFKVSFIVYQRKSFHKYRLSCLGWRFSDVFCSRLILVISHLGVSHFESQVPVFYSKQDYLASLYWLSWFFLHVFFF